LAKSGGRSPAGPAAPPRARRTLFEIGAERFVVLSVEVGGTDATLTPAERAVVSYVVAGATNADIAAARGTSLRTVANQISAVLKKLGASSRADVARIAADWPAPEPSGER
jgi:DNA-binding NarL/FixJ family response regulator